MPSQTYVHIPTCCQVCVGRKRRGRGRTGGNGEVGLTAVLYIFASQDILRSEGVHYTVYPVSGWREVQEKVSDEISDKEVRPMPCSHSISKTDMARHDSLLTRRPPFSRRRTWPTYSSSTAELQRTSLGCWVWIQVLAFSSRALRMRRPVRQSTVLLTDLSCPHGRCRQPARISDRLPPPRPHSQRQQRQWAGDGSHDGQRRAAA